MQFVFVAIGLLIMSFLLALRSLRHLMQMKEVGEVKKKLQRGKIVFKK